jgi:hypothetical protein
MNYSLGIIALNQHPLNISIPDEAVIQFAEEDSPRLDYRFVYRVDAVLRKAKSSSPEQALAVLESELGVKKSTEAPAFWHMRHWDDKDPLSTFIVGLDDRHPCQEIAGKQVIASSKLRFFANPCLAPQIAHEPPILALVDEEGNMILPDDKPLDDSGQPVPIGEIHVPQDQFPDRVQLEEARARLRAFGYCVSEN